MLKRGLTMEDKGLDTLSPNVYQVFKKTLKDMDNNYTALVDGLERDRGMFWMTHPADLHFHEQREIRLELERLYREGVSNA